MLAADVLQLLEMVVGGETGAETLDRLIAAILRAEAALPVVASQLPAFAVLFNFDAVFRESAAKNVIRIISVLNAYYGNNAY